MKTPSSPEPESGSPKKKPLAKRIFFSCLKIGVILYGVILLLFWLGQRYMMYPGRYVDKELAKARTENWQAEYFPLTREGVRCDGWLKIREGKPLLVYYTGNSVDAALIMNWLGSYEMEDYSVATMNYRGYGMSEGAPSQEAIVGDAVAFLDAVLEKTQIPAHEVRLAGESLGSGVACQVAARREVGALLLFVPFYSFDSIALEKFPWLPLSWILEDRYESYKVAPAIKAKTTIFAGSADKVIPPEKQAKKLAQVFSPAATYHEYAGIDHKGIREGKGFYEDLKEACLLPEKATSQPCQP